MPFATTWMNSEGIMLSGTSQKSKYCIISLIFGTLKVKHSNITIQTQTYRYREQTWFPVGRRKEGAVI